MALADSLISYWSLEDLTDSKGANTLTNNAVVTFPAGKVANAANFVAASVQYLSIVNNATVQAGDIDITLTAWVYFTTINLATTLVTKGGVNAEWRLHHLASGALTWAVRDTTNAVTTSAAWGSNAVAGVWYFVACRHNATADLISISINAGTPVTAATAGGVRSAISNFAIGALPAPSNPHNGMIDEVGWWKRYLSDAEITDLYNGGSGRNYAYVSTAGGGITATAAITLGAMTAAATGVLAIAATASVTLSACTLAATGKLAISGQLTTTLGSLTLAATGAGQQAITGSASITLGEMTLSSLGLVVIIGAATITLGSLSMIASERAPVIELAFGFVYGAARDGVVVGAMAQAVVYGATNTGEVS